jgi:hypothetical protein
MPFPPPARRRRDWLVQGGRDGGVPAGHDVLMRRAAAEAEWPIRTIARGCWLGGGPWPAGDSDAPDEHRATSQQAAGQVSDPADKGQQHRQSQEGGKQPRRLPQRVQRGRRPRLPRLNLAETGSRRPRGGSLVLPRAQAGGIWPDGAGMPDPQPQALHQPTRPPEPATPAVDPVGRLRWLCRLPCGLVACHGVHRPLGPRAGQTARPGISGRNDPCHAPARRFTRSG